jgi:hypothetical protein
LVGDIEAVARVEDGLLLDRVVDDRLDTLGDLQCSVVEQDEFVSFAGRDLTNRGEELGVERADDLTFLDIDERLVGVEPGFDGFVELEDACADLALAFFGVGGKLTQLCLEAVVLVAEDVEFFHKLFGVGFERLVQRGEFFEFVERTFDIDDRDGGGLGDEPGLGRLGARAPADKRDDGEAREDGCAGVDGLSGHGLGS